MGKTMAYWAVIRGFGPLFACLYLDVWLDLALSKLMYWGVVGLCIYGLNRDTKWINYKSSEHPSISHCDS